MTADTDFAIVPFVSIVPIVSKKIFNFGPSTLQPPHKKNRATQVPLYLTIRGEYIIQRTRTP